MPLIELRRIHKRFARLLVLDGVELTIEAGESIVVIGASGSGKSVLLKHIVGLLRPDAGQVWFDGRRIDVLPERQLMKIREPLYESLSDFTVATDGRKVHMVADAIFAAFKAARAD